MISILRTAISEHHSRGAHVLVPQPESQLPGGALLWPAQPCLLPRAGWSRLHTWSPYGFNTCLPARGSEGMQSFQRGAHSSILLPEAHGEVCLSPSWDNLCNRAGPNLLFVKTFINKTSISLDKRSKHSKSSFIIICFYKPMPACFP